MKKTDKEFYHMLSQVDEIPIALTEQWLWLDSLRLEALASALATGC